MRQLLVTGATGFVGRNLLLLTQAESVLAPVRDQAKLRACLAEDGVAGVTALPTEPANWPSNLQPSHAVLCAGVLFARSRDEYFATNVDWTLRVLHALPSDCHTIVFSSQSAGGPTPPASPSRSERDPDTPLTWYGESKLALERRIASEFPDRRITILRPPMILGARDSATLPLFKMAGGVLRTKPGLRPKAFTFLAVEDVVSAIHAAWTIDERGPFYIGSEAPISDAELISTAASCVGGRGLTLPVPLPVVRLLALVVDAIPSLRAATPSLTRDRAKEIWPDRWVVDSSLFRSRAPWQPRVPLKTALEAACRHYKSSGLL